MSSSRARRTRVVLDLAQRQRDGERSLVVIKIGGSLLGWPELIDRVEWLVTQRQESRCLIVCGGGQAADAVRRWQQAYNLSDDQAHWLALRAVSLNEALLQSVLPGSTLVEDEEELLAAWQRQERPILACEPFLRDREPASTAPLPHNWDVTSDSIAAWCAQQLNAAELILAKSIDLEPDLTLEAAAARGLVDPYFPQVLSGVSLSWINLRAEAATITHWG